MILQGGWKWKSALVVLAIFAAAALSHPVTRSPRGRTATYSDLARRADHLRAVCAVGSACGANPLPLFVPCHRVVAVCGRLGGFSSGWAWKVHLLLVEGAWR
jgi:O-6-methylguanine DNA methyltransferase